MKPGPWWRAQNNCVHSSKLVRLSDKAHRNWFNLNCVANTHGGILPDLETVATDLRITEARAAAAIAELVSKKLFDKREDGSFVPHDYEEWQFKTDATDPTNADRQKRFRKKHSATIKELKALRDSGHNALRNGVTNVSTKRPETESENITTTVRVERGPSREGSSLADIAAQMSKRAQ